MSLRLLKFTFAMLAIFIMVALDAHALSAAEPSSSDPALPLHGLHMGDATGVGAVLQFTPVESEPIACTAHMRGALALTQRMRLCVCDGERWTFEDNGTACDWNAGRAHGIEAR
jgi:hypothetical protein